MTTYFPRTLPTLVWEKHGGRGLVDVISVVMSGPSNISCSWWLMAKFRSWREGTDPAKRGREGQRKAKRATGGMT